MNRNENYRGNISRNEYDVSNEDYDYEMLYGRSGMTNSRNYNGNNSRQNASGNYSDEETYDEDDYDSNYGSSKEYSSVIYRNPTRDYDDDYAHGSSSHYNRGSYGDRSSGYGYKDRDYNENMSRSQNQDYDGRGQGNFSHGSSYDREEGDNRSFRRRSSGNY